MSESVDDCIKSALDKLAEGTKYTIVDSSTYDSKAVENLENKLKEATSIIEDSKNLADLVIEYDLLDYSDFNNEYISFELSDRVSRAWKTCDRVDKFLGIKQRTENSWSKKHEYSNPEAIMLRQEKTIQDLENKVKELETVVDNLRNYARSSV